MAITPSPYVTRRGIGRSRARPISEINVTPFVDVMLVLLIVFMVAAPLLTVGVPLQLPSAPARALPSGPAGTAHDQHRRRGYDLHPADRDCG